MRPKPPALREYQLEMVERVRAAMRRGRRRIILQMPTGAGKSVTIAYMIARAAEKNLSSWLLCHRKELLDQLSSTLWNAWVTHGTIMAGRVRSADPVQVASVQTLVRRVSELRAPDLLAIDECHHAKAASYEKIIAACPNSRIIGLTATPVRTDGQGLGDIFEEIVEGPTVAELTDMGFLAPYEIIGPPQAIDVSGVHTRGGDYATDELEVVVDQNAIIGDAVQHYLKYVAPRTCLVFCVSRKHARHVAEMYRAAGIDARYVGGDTEKAERDATIRGFRKGTPPVIVSVDLFGEGLDAPGLQAVQLLRPTQSLGLHLQQIGRALRPESGKDRAIVLDHVGNTWRHGLPDDEREWSLEGRKKRKRDDEPILDIVRCEKCLRIYRPAATCPHCGWKRDVQGRMPLQTKDGELERIDPEEHRRRRAAKKQEGKARTLEDWVRLAIERGFKPGWAGIRYALRGGHKADSREAKKAVHEARELAEKIQRDEAAAA